MGAKKSGGKKANKAVARKKAKPAKPVKKRAISKAVRAVSKALRGKATPKKASTKSKKASAATKSASGPGAKRTGKSTLAAATKKTRGAGTASKKPVAAKKLKAAPAATDTAPKKRGRKPKNAEVSAGANGNGAAAAAAAAAPKKRGRKPKSTGPISIQAAHAAMGGSLEGLSTDLEKGATFLVRSPIDQMDPETGELVCREVACDSVASTSGYCRLHYIKNWKKIKRKEVILREGKLNQYIEELVAKYPDKYIEAIRHDLAADKDFAKVIYDLDLDESADDLDYDAESVDALIDNIRRDFEEDDSEF